MMDKDHMDEMDLEALFENARRDVPAIPDALMARVMADAEQMQPRGSIWVRLSEALGGLPGVGGLVTATCVGVWLGVAPPATVPDLAGQVLGFETLEDPEWDAVGVTGFGWDLEEG